MELRALRGVASLSTLLVALANALPRWTLQHLRVWLLRAAGCQIASGSAFLGEVALIGPTGAATMLAVEAGCMVAPGVTFGLDARIELGRNVSIGPGATLYTGTHHVGPHASRMDPGVVARPVVVEDGAWIGMAALVLPGVRIGAGAVVSAGAVVTSDVPPDTLVAGNPATVVRSLPG
jgi:maltose O-acetyltransferase